MLNQLIFLYSTETKLVHAVTAPKVYCL